MTNYGDQFMKCPECGGVAEAECVDVGVGLYIKDEYECSCGYNSAADGRANVATYDDWFPDSHPIAAAQQGSGWICPINYDGCMANCGNYGCGN